MYKNLGTWYLDDQNLCTLILLPVKMSLVIWFSNPEQVGHNKLEGVKEAIKLVNEIVQIPNTFEAGAPCVD